MTAASLVPLDLGDARRILREVPTPLLVAIGVSIALHLALLVMGVRSLDLAGLSGSAPRPVQAALVTASPAPSFEPLPMPAPLTMPSPLREKLENLVLPPVAPAAAAAEPPAAAPRGAVTTGPGLGKAMGALLQDRTRLGELYDRTRSQFPVEIDRPPRMTERIVAQYPAAALAAGREDTVVAWVVVNEEGRASEIEIAEGGDEFADQVRIALRNAHFRPAEDNLRPIRFPLALQFDFRLEPGADTGAVAK